MKHTVPTLTALAAFAVIGAPAFGASIADDLVIKPAVALQIRAQFGAGGTDNTGKDYNIFNGAVGETDTARFSLRRARFGASAKNTTGWDAVFQLRAGERNDAGGGTGPTSSQPVVLYYANIGKTFKTDSLDHRLMIGLDKPFNNESSISSSNYMFPSDRAIANLIEYRSAGIGYSLKHELFKFGVNVADGGNWSNLDVSNSGAAKPASQGAVAPTFSKPGLFYSARLEFAPGADYMPVKKAESYAGAEGTHLLFGFDFQKDNQNVVSVFPAAPAAATANVTQSTTIFGPDVMFHLNGLSAMAEYRQLSVSQSVDGTGTTAAADVKGNAYDVLIGYAFLTDIGMAIEPAVRYGKTDLNKDKDEGATSSSKYANGEWKAGAVSGSEFTFGLNFYWNGNANKTQLAYSLFTGEDSAVAGQQAPKDHVFTLQQQVTF